MSASVLAREIEEGEQRLVLSGIGWDQYVTINDAFPERRGLRMIYIDGSLTFLTLSLRHDWRAECLGMIVTSVAFGCGMEWEVAGSATFRLQELNVGVEGDRTYYFGAHAERMRGPQDIDLTTQPPPDLAIEVEVTHPATHSMAVYGRLGVPEVWRLDARRRTLAFLVLGEGGAYHPAARSRGLPLLGPEDVLDQLRLAEELGLSSRWFAQLTNWIRDTLLPRAGGG